MAERRNDDTVSGVIRQALDRSEHLHAKITGILAMQHDRCGWARREERESAPCAVQTENNLGDRDVAADGVNALRRRESDEQVAAGRGLAVAPLNLGKSKTGEEVAGARIEVGRLKNLKSLFLQILLRRGFEGNHAAAPVQFHGSRLRQRGGSHEAEKDEQQQR